MNKKLKCELKNGRIVGPFKVPPPNNLNISPLGLVPKMSPNEFKLIHDFSYPCDGTSLNACIPPEASHVQYETFDYVTKIIIKVGREAFVVKADIASVFKVIPVHSDKYHLLGFQWEGNIYYDRCLEASSTAIQRVLHFKLGVKHVSHIVDYFMLIGPPL